MSAGPLETPTVERFDLPWQFFRGRFLLVVESVVVLLAVLVVAGLKPEGLPSLMAAVFPLIGFTFAYVGSVAFVRSISLVGPTLRYTYRSRHRAIDLAQDTRIRRFDDGFFAARLLLHEGSNERPHSIPLLGESGRRILAHVLAHIPESARPIGEALELRPYKPSFFRPREESMPLPEVR